MQPHTQTQVSHDQLNWLKFQFYRSILFRSCSQHHKLTTRMMMR